MSPVWGHAAGVFTVLMMTGFIGIWIWAWLPRHRHRFGELAHLPMEDDPGQAHETSASTGAEPRR